MATDDIDAPSRWRRTASCTRRTDPISTISRGSCRPGSTSSPRCTSSRATVTAPSLPTGCAAPRRPEARRCTRAARTPASRRWSRWRRRRVASIERISILESVDLRAYENEAMYRAMGIDLEPTDPRAAVLIEEACRSFRDQVVVMAHALDVELDEVCFDADFAVAEEDLDVGFMRIGKGRVAAIWGRSPAGSTVAPHRVPIGVEDGERTDPDWPVEHGYVIDVEGKPYRCRIEPGEGWSGAGALRSRS
ncbi:MAG: hypothetical protein R2695_12700 [Acidimicrobiales bacterium]